MEIRIDRVRIALSRRTLVLTWDAAQQLRERLRGSVETERLDEMFAKVGTSRPVKFADPAEKGAVVSVLEFWTHEVGVDGLPAGVWDLRCELLDDLAR